MVLALALACSSNEMVLTLEKTWRQRRDSAAARPAGLVGRKERTWPSTSSGRSLRRSLLPDDGDAEAMSIRSGNYAVDLAICNYYKVKVSRHVTDYV
jgi:hypothetical protein